MSLNQKQLIAESVDSSPHKMGVVVIEEDSQLCHLHCNSACAELLGIDQERLIGSPLSEIDLPRDVLNLWSETCLESWNQQTSTSFHYRDMESIPPRRLTFTITPLLVEGVDDRKLCSYQVEDPADGSWLDSPGQSSPSQLQSSYAADDSNSEAEAHFRHISDTAPVLLWTSDTQGERNYFNQTWLDFTGRSIEEELGRGWIQRVHPEDVDEYLEAFLNAFHSREGFRIEYRLQRYDGRFRWMLDDGVPRFSSDGRFLGYVGTSLDITSRRQTEERLRMSERWYRELIEGTDNLVMQVDGEGRLMFINPICRSVFGAEPEECIGFSFLDFVHADDVERTRQQFESWQRGSSPAISFENRQVSRQGEVRDMLWTVSPHFDAKGQLLSANCIAQDITERKRSERIHKIQSQVLDSMTEGVILSNGEGFVLYTNPALDRIFGHELCDLVGQQLTSLIAPGQEQIRQQADQRLEQEGTWNGELRHLKKDGSEFLASVRVHTIEVDGESHRISVLEDITEAHRASEDRRKLDVRLQHAQKLESLGVLAGGIAHDFNNLLMVILGNSSLVLQDTELTRVIRADVEQIESAAIRATELTKQMLAYSGKGHFMVEPLDLSAALVESQPMLERSLSGGARLLVQSARDVPTIEADPAQLRQVLVNLVTNAAEAIGEQPGIVEVKTGFRHCDREFLDEASLAEELPEGLYSYLEVSDTGPGMEDEILAKIFDPFFTTRFTGRGLGLAAVLGIVRGHRGGIHIESQPGKGSRFTVLLPCLEETVAEPERGVGTQVMEGTILLVDDDGNVLSMAERMLKQLGFGVLSAESGSLAVQLYQRFSDDIVAVILDMTMTGMSGEETFHELQKIDQDVKVVLSSGYSERIAYEHFEAQGLAGFLQKPYRPTELVHKMDEVLNLRQ